LLATSTIATPTQELGRSPTPQKVAQFSDLAIDDVVEAVAAGGSHRPG
jgi:DNA-directed RNA polymerase specialized sigma subunit